MPQFERIEKTRRSRAARERDQVPSTFPEDFVRRRVGGGGPDSDELLEQIERELQEVTARELGRAASIDHQ